MGEVIANLDPLTMPGDRQTPERYIRHDKLQACAFRYVRWKATTLAIYRPVYEDDWHYSCVGPDLPDLPSQQAALLDLKEKLEDGPAIVITPALKAFRDRGRSSETLTIALMAEALRLAHYMAEHPKPQK